MKVGDLVQPKATLLGSGSARACPPGAQSDDAYAWIGLVIAMLKDDGVDIAVVNWNRERFESEEEYCYQLEIVNESR
jgi:hypothetical protein